MIADPTWGSIFGEKKPSKTLRQSQLLAGKMGLIVGIDPANEINRFGLPKAFLAFAQARG